MSLKLVPDPAAATVTVTASVTANPVSITRTDVNGTHPVLRRTGHIGTFGLITVVDRDPARHGQIRYDVTSAGVLQSATTTMPEGPTGPRLHLPVLPHHGVTAVALLDDLTTTSAAGYTAHDVIGRTDPVLTLGPPRPTRGRLTLRVVDVSAAAATVDLYRRGHVALLRLPTGGAPDLWHLGESVEATPAHVVAGVRRWDVTVSYLQVPAPPGPILGDYGWTFADVTALGTFADVTAAYPDLDALTVGPL